jgi:hypothetical protein
MKTTRYGKLLLVPVIAVICWVVVTRSAPGHQPSAPDPDLEILAKYKKWTLVNPTPELMEPLPAISCGLIPGRREGSPHLHKYVSVFVNSVGKEAMMKMARPMYPVGSMIVKEKLASADSTKPELLTAMIKREAGYNPESGDWEYLVLDGAASEIVERGKLTRCSGCHQAYKHRDFITRTYLPSDIQRKLKN